MKMKRNDIYSNSTIRTNLMVRKKKTGVKAGTRDPEFNETLNFDMAPDNLANVVFLVMVSHRSVPEVC